VLFLAFVLDASAFQAGIALDHVLVVRVGVADKLAVLELDDLSAGSLDEGAVVGTTRNAPGSRKMGFQTLDGGQIQVVGRLVEQQQIRLSRQHLGQFQPATFAARKRGHRAREIRRGQSDLLGKSADAAFDVVAALDAIALLQFTVALEIRRLGGAQPRLKEAISSCMARRCAKGSSRASSTEPSPLCCCDCCRYATLARPSIRTSPASAESSPASNLSTVDLPFRSAPAKRCDRRGG